jgi:hypothetical protein
VYRLPVSSDPSLGCGINSHTIEELAWSYPNSTLRGKKSQLGFTQMHARHLHFAASVVSLIDYFGVVWLPLLCTFVKHMLSIINDRFIE